MTRLRKILAWLLLGLVACAVVAFAVVNRAEVHLSLFPLPYEIGLPAFLLVLLTFAAGVLAGGAALWRKLHRVRRQLSLETRRAKALADQIAAMEAERAASPSLPLSAARGHAP